MSTHTTILNHSFDGENDVTLVITYTYAPGHNGIGPTYTRPSSLETRAIF